VLGGGLILSGNFTDTTNFEYLNFSGISFELSQSMGTDVFLRNGDNRGMLCMRTFFLTSSNNYFYIRASYDVNGGVVFYRG
jgi:hypothetical protein